MPHATEGSFPNDDIFARLIELSKERDGIVVDDPTIGVQATYPQLLTDVEQTRLKLADNLKRDNESFDSIIGQNYHIGYVGHASYEYAVAAFAILALGGVVVPLREFTPSARFGMEYTDTEVALTIDEQDYGKTLEKCDLRCILVARNFEHQAAAFQKCVKSSVSGPIDVLAISVNTPQNPPASSFGIDESFRIPATRPGWVNWTSGSTGVPKGAIHDRRLFTNPPKQFDQATIAHRPAFYIAGTWAVILSLLMGRHVSVAPMNAGPDVLWERIRRGNLTSFTATVAFYDALARYFRSHLESSPAREEYLQGTRGIQTAAIGGSMPVPSLLKYWRDVLGCPLSIAWGSTELGGIVTRADPETAIDIEVSTCSCF